MTELTERMLDQLKSKDYRNYRVMGDDKPILFPVDIFGFNLSSINRDLTIEGNLAPNYRKVIERGFLPLRDDLYARVKSESDPLRHEFGENMLNELDMCIVDCKYMREVAKKADNIRLYDALKRVPLSGANSFYEACVTLKACIYFLRRANSTHIGLGRFDQYMYPYFTEDLRRGVTKEELFETLEAFFISLNYDSDLYPGIQIGDNGQSIVLGGKNIDGSTAYNELSEMCLKASLELSLIDPKVNLRVDKNTPDEIFELGTRLTKQGLGFPQYSNDDVVIEGLISLGYDPIDAYNYGVAACWEFVIPEKGADIPNFGTLNFPLAVLNAMKKSLRSLKSFDELMNEVETEIISQCNEIIEDKANKMLRKGRISALLSFFVDDSADRFLDLHHGGAKYSNFGCHGAGIANAADALAAVKMLIFDKKVITADELLSALEADFKGYEALQSKLIECPKMGNNDDYVDDIAAKLMDVFSSYMNGRSNRRFGIWRAGTGSAMGYVIHARKCPATADGRNAFAPYSSSFSPSLNIKTDGLLSVVQSFTKYDMRKIINGGPLTIEIHDTMFRNDIGIKKIAMLVKTFIALGGHQLQLNSINRDRLLEAQAHPEEHKNLIVRVWGWSGYFCELDTEYQDHIIKRTEYMS